MQLELIKFLSSLTRFKAVAFVFRYLWIQFIVSMQCFAVHTRMPQLLICILTCTYSEQYVKPRWELYLLIQSQNIIPTTIWVKFLKHISENKLFNINTENIFKTCLNYQQMFLVQWFFTAAAFLRIWPTWSGIKESSY